MKPIVTVTHNFPEVALKELRSRTEVLYNSSGNSLTPAELIDRAGKSHALISYLTDRIDAAVIDAGGERLRIIANYGAGFNNIDISMPKRKKSGSAILPVFCTRPRPTSPGR